MNPLHDRVALELGRALLRALIAEERLAQMVEASHNGHQADDAPETKERETHTARDGERDLN